MGVCDTCVGCGIEVAANGSMKVDLQQGGGIVCDLTDPGINPALSGLYLNVDGTSVTTKPDGIVRAQLARTGMRKTSAATFQVSPSGAYFQINNLLTTVVYDMFNGAPGGFATSFNRTTAAKPQAFATIPAGAAGLYEWTFTGAPLTGTSLKYTCRFTVTDPNGNGGGNFDLHLNGQSAGTVMASMGPWPLAEGATIEVGLIQLGGTVIIITNATFTIARVGN